MRKLVWLFLLFCQLAEAQVQKNVEFEIVGKPSWQMIIPMGPNGVLLFAKTDMTKAKLFMFDDQLSKLWETEIYLDVERKPTAYTFSDSHVTFLFRESQGMYYQLFKVNLTTGDVKIHGFELREYFVDQDYIFLDNSLMMAGANEKGGAYYIYNFDTKEGRLVQSGFEGKTNTQLFEYNPSKKLIESVWAIKTVGYSNEKKKKGEFIKDSFVTYAEIDTSGKTLREVKISQRTGKFPVSGKMVTLNDRQKVVMGNYQSNTGEKGIYFAKIGEGKEADPVFYSFAQLLAGQPEYSDSDLRKITAAYNFLPNDPIKSDGTITFGGVFYKTEFKSVSERNNNDPYYSDPYGRNNGLFGRNSSRTQTRQVFSGYNYLSGFVAMFDFDGSLKEHNRIDINQVSPQLRQTLSYNINGAVAYCVKGNLAAKNFKIGNRPILYKLSNDEMTAANRNYIPAYQEVRFWYDNYFIADGSRNKIEAISVNDNQDESTAKSRKKKKTPASFSQVRKIIYLTKIASGS
ncbi:hypothetical protein GVN16_22205 [Emticicia sp. CRIBPO]|uniref:hypothetical protein n=1 Tax=Emticicia sp. CRIBPO TaxID=2683258 RepID=UPI001412E882|nr:hypothetical protein [Emticicia sp. CRIBPO]NBA88503.1 hypothetical protein [Emticicia sp. CRIBPO]